MGPIWYFLRSDFQFPYILASQAKVYGNLILKSLRFVWFGTKQTHFKDDSTSLVYIVDSTYDQYTRETGVYGIHYILKSTLQVDNIL